MRILKFWVAEEISKMEVMMEDFQASVEGLKKKKIWIQREGRDKFLGNLDGGPTEFMWCSGGIYVEFQRFENEKFKPEN